MRQVLTKIFKLFSGGGLLSLSIQLVGFGLAFLLSIVVTNFYGDKAYGDYVIVFSTVDLLALFAMAGYNQLFARYLPQWGSDKAKQAALYVVGRRKTLRNAAVFAVLLILILWFYQMVTGKENESIWWFLLGATLCLPVLALTNLQSSFLYGIRYHLWPQINDKIMRPVAFLLVISVLYLTNITSNHLLWAFVFSALVSFLVVFVLKRRQFSTQTIQQDYDFTDARKTILLLVLINVINLIFSKIDTFMVGYYLGVAFSGVNNIYMKITSAMLLAMTGLMFAASPVIAENLALQKIHLVRNEIKKLVFFSFGIAVFMFAGMVLFAPWFFGLYDSSLFIENTDAMYIYGLCNFVNLFTGPATVILMLSNKLKPLIYGYSAELLLNLLLNMLLIPLFSIKGAAWATLISEGLVNVYFAYICYKTLRVNTTLIGK